MPKTKRRRCKAGCEPAAPRGPRDQRVPSCPCSPAASRVPARSWGAGDPETPRDRSKESATEAARPWSGGGHTWKREGAQGPRRRVPVFPSPLLSRRPVRPVPPDPTADSRCRDPQRPARADAPFPADDGRGPGTPRNRGRSGRDGKGRRKMPDPRPSSPQVPSAGGEGDGAPPGVPPQDTSGQFPSAHSEAQTPCRIPLSGEGFVTDMETWGLTEDSVNCQPLRNFRRTAKVSTY